MLCAWPHIDFREAPCRKEVVPGTCYCSEHGARVMDMLPQRRLDDSAGFLAGSKLAIKFEDQR